ncbi:putative F-box domain-containing protein [Rosa chinensis]|uniref:Putative F-box domain-containing protein n=1 Tax=Rosa chinensis TaxID=74649 RepID=A0A2P6QHV2_ROSCH|nr:F-box protein CPR1 [Rosa chinensis]XP_024198375.1 F-box protein CPR1 [Rosa chinensis]XP_024198376.1 F-box protein CPR1 [Rosa chinensis]XP_024198377.1 F-box protein CPR1 [Rosa chinensis]PRQ33751.1 putative F-box domain-containing protein [Rosa chinensis]
MSRKKLESEAKFDTFPEEIRQDIFLRLPIKSLIRCTAVRKAWRSVIRNPSFIRTHLHRTHNSNEQNDTQLLLIHGFAKKAFSFDYSDSEDDIQELYSLYYDNPAFDEHCKVEVPTIELANACFRVVGTCNGLVCLADDLGLYMNTYILSNPSIRKSVALPGPNVTYCTHGGHVASIGFGFDAMTNDYKVVRLVTLLDEDSQDALCRTVVEVFSLATGSWSMLPDVSPRFEMDARTPQALVNGALHWHAKRRKEDDFYYFILIFDVSRGLFHETMMPESLKCDPELTLQLSVSGDGKSIALFSMYSSHFCADPFFDIWVMNEYCIHESWTKLIRLRPHGALHEVLLLSSLLPEALCFRKSSEVVVSKQSDTFSCSRHCYCPGYELFSIDLGSQQFKSLGICGYSYYTVNSYEESLVLLDMDNAVCY